MFHYLKDFRGKRMNRQSDEAEIALQIAQIEKEIQLEREMKIALHFLQDIIAITDRRDAANNRLALSLTGLLACLLFAEVGSLFYIACLLGLVLSVKWFTILQSYGHLLKAKYEIVGSIEKSNSTYYFYSSYIKAKSYGYQSINTHQLSFPTFFAAAFALIALVSFWL
jgi:hypothetical protein